jgi:hypothetical protein
LEFRHFQFRQSENEFPSVLDAPHMRGNVFSSIATIRLA